MHLIEEGLVILLCVCVEEEVSSRVKGVLERLQASVDPFDLDVFMPYMLSNLESQLSRSTVSE